MNAEQMSSRMLTFLFTDIEGSAKLWERDSVAMHRVISKHDALLSEVVSEHGGRVFKTVGDACHAAFPDATAALEAAIEAQRRVAETAFDMAPIRVRIALHSGVAHARAGDFFGPTVVRASRLLTIGHGGQVLVSQAARDLITHAAQGGRGFSRLGKPAPEGSGHR